MLANPRPSPQADGGSFTDGSRVLKFVERFVEGDRADIFRLGDALLTREEAKLLDFETAGGGGRNQKLTLTTTHSAHRLLLRAVHRRLPREALAQCDGVFSGEDRIPNTRGRNSLALYIRVIPVRTPKEVGHSHMDILALGLP